MTLIPAVTPLRLLFDRSANLGHPRRVPLAYAYVLVDLTGTPADEMAYVHASLADRTDRMDRPGRSGLRVSDEVTWRLALRTDRDGYLKDPYRLEVPPEDADTDSAEYRRLLDEAPMFGVIPGLDLNLWWCREKVRFQAALTGTELRRGRERIEPVTRERQLLKVSTKLRRPVDIELAVALARRHVPGLSREEIEREVGAPLDYARTTPMFEADPQGRVRGLVLELEDVALTYAMYLSGRILDLSRFSADNELPLTQAYMDRLHQVLERYERGEMDWTDRFNTILEDASRRDAEYWAIRHNLSTIPRALLRTIDAAGEQLDRLRAQALDEARWHHPRQRAAGCAALMAKALTRWQARELWRKVLDPDELDARCERVLRGEPEEVRTPLEGALQAAVVAVDLGGKSSDAARAASEWIELGLSQVLGRHTEEIERLLSRSASLLTLFEESLDGADTTLVGQADPVELLLMLDENAWLRRTVPRWTARARRGAALFERLDAMLAGVNAAVAFYQACDDGTFRNWAAAAQSAADVAEKIEQLRSIVCRELRVPAETFSRVVNLWGVAISFVDAVEAGRQGNRVAMIGHVLGGAGGLVEVLASRSTPAGFVAAVLIVAGATIVAFSLSDDAAWVLENFDDISEGRRSRAQDASSLVRQADGFMSDVRQGIRGAQRAAERLGL